MKYKSKERFGCLKLFLALASFSILFSFFAMGFSVGSLSAINVVPGESVETTFSLMNLGEDAEDVTIEIVVGEGAQYISFPDGVRYDVPAGEIVSATASVSVSSDANIGDEYPVSIIFNAIEGGVNEGETVDIVFGYSKSFNINVVPVTGDDVGEGGGNLFLLVIIIIVLALILIIILFALRKKNE